LKKVKEDVTYNQNIEPFGSSVHNYYSYDLTAATDRIPIQLYEIMLEHLLDRDYAQAWKRLMIGIPFSYEGSAVSYAAGQPMGMYSSWPLMAMSHHIVVRYAA